MVSLRSLKRFFEKPVEKEPEVVKEVPVVELEEGTPSHTIEPVYIKSLELKSPVEVQDVISEVQSGNIMVVDLSPLLGQDPAQVRHAIDQLRGASSKIGGEIGKLTDSKIIMTPKFIKIKFKKSD
ncbi:MAG: cell division protein SepF [Candidatus Hadarchaeales archaeon]